MVDPNKSYERSSSNNSNELKVGLIDIDTTIINHINNHIKPTIKQGDNMVIVKTIFANPERWKSIKKDGYLKDKTGKILYPIIVIKRESINKNRDLSRKLDARSPQLFQYFPVSYTKKNKYDRFSIIQGRKPIKEYIKVAIPDYIKLKYSGIIYTNYVFQANKIIEAIEYNSDSYWGEKGKYMFKTRIDNFSSQTELSVGEDRVIKTSFSMEVNGYLLPEILTRDISYNDTHLTKGRITFEEQIVDSKGKIIEKNKEKHSIKGECDINIINEDLEWKNIEW